MFVFVFVPHRIPPPAQRVASQTRSQHSSLDTPFSHSPCLSQSLLCAGFGILFLVSHGSGNLFGCSIIKSSKSFLVKLHLGFVEQELKGYAWVLPLSTFRSVTVPVPCSNPLWGLIYPDNVNKRANWSINMNKSPSLSSRSAANL